MSSTSSQDATQTATAIPSPTETGGRNNGSGPSSPLLFFVALGFGVVFTNLWIIVGVKYCFRYNQRNRQRMAGEDPDAVDLNQMPRQHRRRREKKLMTIDEVNEKFPLTKYKTWRGNQAEKGLPTAGGIDPTSPSRPASIRDVPRDSVETKETKEAQETKETKTEEKLDKDTAQPSTPRPKTATTEPETPVQKVISNDDDDDDHIQTAVPAEQLPDPGDTCAICIDTIEDDDDIRGLTCGHAFHASCVDPWLTSRRACCPLCKADYYTPKPRPEGDQRIDNLGVTGQNVNAPPFAFIGGRDRRANLALPGRFMHIVYDDRDRSGAPRVTQERPIERVRRERREAREADRLARRQAGSEVEQPPSWRDRLPNIGERFRSWRGQQNDPAAPTTEGAPTVAPTNVATSPEIRTDQNQPVTPAQLEAGQQRPT